MRLLGIASIANKVMNGTSNDKPIKLIVRADAYNYEPKEVMLWIEHETPTNYTATIFRRGNYLLMSREFQTTNGLGAELMQMVINDRLNGLSLGFRAGRGHLHNNINITEKMEVYEVSIADNAGCKGAYCWIEDDDGEVNYQLEPKVIRARATFYEALNEHEQTGRIAASSNQRTMPMPNNYLKFIQMSELDESDRYDGLNIEWIEASPDNEGMEAHARLTFYTDDTVRGQILLSASTMGEMES